MRPDALHLVWRLTASRPAHGESNYSPRWLVSQEDYDKVADDLMTINIALDAAQEIADLSTDPDDLRLDDLLPEGGYTKWYSWIETADVEKHPRAKYPQAFHIESKSRHYYYQCGGLNVDSTSGTIWYLRNGEIGKAELSIWRNAVFYVAKIKSCGDSGIYASEVTIYDRGCDSPTITNHKL